MRSVVARGEPAGSRTAGEAHPGKGYLQSAAKVRTHARQPALLILRPAYLTFLRDGLRGRTSRPLRPLRRPQVDRFYKAECRQDQLPVQEATMGSHHCKATAKTVPRTAVRLGRL